MYQDYQILVAVSTKGIPMRMFISIDQETLNDLPLAKLVELQAMIDKAADRIGQYIKKLDYSVIHAIVTESKVPGFSIITAIRENLDCGLFEAKVILDTVREVY